MILLAGGTGTLGTKLLTLLLAGDDGVRVLTRDAVRADELRGGGAEVIVDGNRSLIRAAVEGNVDHVILMSVYDAAPDSPLSLHRMKYAAEQALVASGLDWTIIRSVPFLETWIGVIGVHLADQGTALVLGPGENPINFVSVNDVATVIDRAVHDRAFRRRTVNATGHDNLTFNDPATGDLPSSNSPPR